MSVETKIEIRWTYACDDVRFPRKDNPSAWITTDKVNGAMFMSYPVFEFIPGTEQEREPKRYGDLVFDIDTGDKAVADAIAIIAHFEGVYGVDADQWRIYLSGKKGVHLELSSPIMGTEDGHELLPLAYKRVAKDVEGVLNVKLDTSMYNRGTGKPYRQPNIMRDTGTCKRQIEHDTLFIICDEDEYRAACSEPGPVWEPENKGRNNLLAEKLAQYIIEAEEQQSKLRSAPKLADDEIDRLALTRPACVSILANLTQSNGATFNDVAIQLTAYAVTINCTEQQFIDGCSVFIHNYPSSSLTTIQKREDNCRARFRTMAAHGYQFSCGGTKSLGFGGFTCEGCKCATKQAFTSSVLDASDMQQLSNTMEIPESVLNPGGLISLGIDGLRKAGAPDIVQFSLPVVLSVLANAISGKIVFDRVWPNIFNVKIGATSLGKTDTDKIMREAMGEYIKDSVFYGPTGFSSGIAIFRSLIEQPIQLLTIDECTSLFKRYNGSLDQTSDGIRDALLEVYSNAGGVIRRVYADKQKNIEVNCPCMSLIGNATPVIFDAIRSEDFDTGTMQRFDFWAYDGPALERSDIDTNCDEINRFSEAIAKIYASAPPVEGNLAATMRIPYNLGAEPECREMLRAWSKKIIAESNSASSDGEKGILSRKYHLAIKYAMIHIAATRDISAIYAPMRVVDLAYGQAVATMLASWKMETLAGRVSQGLFHKQCEDFKSAILSAMKNGKRPTFKILAHRRPVLKNWRMRESQEVIEVLKKRGEIVIDESKRPTAYFLAKPVQADG